MSTTKQRPPSGLRRTVILLVVGTLFGVATVLLLGVAIRDVDWRLTGPTALVTVTGCTQSPGAHGGSTCVVSWTDPVTGTLVQGQIDGTPSDYRHPFPATVGDVGDSHEAAIGMPWGDLFKLGLGLLFGTTAVRIWTSAILDRPAARTRKKHAA